MKRSSALIAAIAFTLCATARAPAVASDDVIFGNEPAADASIEGSLPFDAKLALEIDSGDKAAKTGPSNALLLLEGVGMALPEYFRGVAQHEGSHALAVILVGGKVESIDILPKMFNGHIRFGETQWSGNFTKAQDTFVDMAPKITDLTIMAAYTAAFESGIYPDNKHLQLLLLVVATSAWIDFSKDLFTTRDDNDTVKAWNNYGLTTETQRLPYRILWGALAAGGALEIGRGFYRLFSHKSPAKDSGERKPKADLRLGPGYVGVGGNF
ncbi:MAG: hypothetical protein HY075_15595 [Deltaproteobacteria bacterium]|nr:hypothetical protein [Deltaproteobacteria bacterium]